MPIIRAQCAFFMEDGLPANVVQNTFHFVKPTWSPTELGQLADALQAFYNDDPGSGNSVGGFFGGTVRQNAHTIRMYDLADPEPRVPVLDRTWNLGFSPSQTSLPSEVALCLSFQAAKVSGGNQARRRGRIYFGPIRTGALVVDSASAARPSDALMIALLEAAQDLATACAAINCEWVVHSPTTGPGSYATLANAWVDNAFDTQRRRGQAAFVRSTATLAVMP